jgi:hypothetical protein
MALEIGSIYESKSCGKFKVISRDGKINHNIYYTIEFELTKYRYSAADSKIKCGSVNDPYYPSVCGIGYIGEAKNGGKPDMGMRPRWGAMIARCYNPNNQDYCRYGAIGVSVCERWLCYTNFVEDVKLLPGYLEMINNKNIIYNLDKDILQQNVPPNKRVYSPTTCMFVPSYMNSEQVALDHYNDHANNYHNVYKNKQSYYNVTIRINNITKRIGRYEDEIVAANHANHARKIYGLPILNINIPYIPPEEVNVQNLKKLPEMVITAKREMVKIINK